MTYNWDGLYGHTATAREHWLAGDWDWAPDQGLFQPRPKQIKMVVCRVWGVHMEQLQGDGRQQPKKIVYARFAAALLMRMKLKMTYPAIARAFDKDDHSTFVHSCARARQLLNKDKLFCQLYAKAVGELKALNAAPEDRFRT